MSLLTELALAIETGDRDQSLALTKQAVQQAMPPKTILDDGILAGMQVVGKRFAAHEIFLPNVLLAAQAMQLALEVLKPLLMEGDLPDLGKIVIGTVQGDLHDLGKNLVAIMLRGAGFEVIDLGKGVSAEDFVKVALEENASVIGMSALLTTTIPVMKEVVDLLKQKGLDDSIKTIVGGAPVTEEWARGIGASAYAYDGTRAVEAVKELVSAG